MTEICPDFLKNRRISANFVFLTKKYCFRLEKYHFQI
jgi:hypothetical protein